MHALTVIYSSSLTLTRVVSLKNCRHNASWHLIHAQHLKDCFPFLLTQKKSWWWRDLGEGVVMVEGGWAFNFFFFSFLFTYLLLLLLSFLFIYLFIITVVTPYSSKINFRSRKCFNLGITRVLVLRVFFVKSWSTTKKKS